MAEKNYGLRLTLGGAPNTPHQFPGVPGLYRPESPTPVGGPGELDLKSARKIAGDDKLPLELVEIKPSELDSHRERARDDLKAARQGLLETTAGARGAEREQVKDEKAAIAGGNG